MSNIAIVILLVLGIVYTCLKKKDERTGLILLELQEDSINISLRYKLRQSRENDLKIIGRVRVGLILAFLLLVISGF
jgi:hypothetical protein